MRRAAQYQDGPNGNANSNYPRENARQHSKRSEKCEGEPQVDLKLASGRAAFAPPVAIAVLIPTDQLSCCNVFKPRGAEDTEQREKSGRELCHIFSQTSLASSGS